MKIGYARVSTADQSLDTQLAALTAAGCERLFEEKVSGASTNGREQLEAALSVLREGDVLVVTRLDRLARSVPDLYGILGRLTAAGATFECIQQAGVSTTSATGKLMLAMLGAIAEFERELIHDRQREGIARRKEAGGYLGVGRKPEVNRERVLELHRYGMSATKIAKVIRKETGSGSRTSVYRILAEEGLVGKPAAEAVTA
jgi:DNA invertase Pin-like site-specific DNA recombinase